MVMNMYLFCTTIQVLLLSATTWSAKYSIRRGNFYGEAEVDNITGEIKVVEGQEDIFPKSSTTVLGEKISEVTADTPQDQHPDYFEMNIGENWCYVLSMCIDQQLYQIHYAAVLHNVDVLYYLEIFGSYRLEGTIDKKSFTLTSQISEEHWAQFQLKFITAYVEKEGRIVVEQFHTSEKQSRFFEIGAISVAVREDREKFVLEFKSVHQAEPEAVLHQSSLNTTFTVSINHAKLNPFLIVGVIPTSGHTIRIAENKLNPDNFEALKDYCQDALEPTEELVTNMGITPVKIYSKIQLLAREGSAERAKSWVAALNILGYCLITIGPDEEGDKKTSVIEIYFTTFDQPITPGYFYSVFFELKQKPEWNCRPFIIDVTINWVEMVASFQTANLKFPGESFVDLKIALSNIISLENVPVTISEQHRDYYSMLLAVSDLVFKENGVGQFSFKGITHTAQNFNAAEGFVFVPGDWAYHEALFETKYSSPNLSDAKFEDFRYIDNLASGQYGRVVLVQHTKNGTHYAMKIIQKNITNDRLITEKNLSASIDFPFLPRLRYHFQDKDQIFLVMDFINGGELFYHHSCLKKFTEDQTRFIAAELILSLEYLHALGFVYRDLKTENILLNKDGHISLIDFGLVKRIGRTRTNSFVGSPNYVALELVNGEEYGVNVDCWSLGILLFELVTGLPPFYDNENVEIYAKIRSGEFTIPAKISGGLSDLIRKLLDPNPITRLTMEQARKHKWFKGVKWDEVYYKKMPVVYTPTLTNDLDTQHFPDKSKRCEIRYTEGPDNYGDKFKFF